MPLDIFSKKKDKEKQPSTIVVDFRERNSLVPSELVKLNCKVEFVQLPVGDYLSGNFVIERKTLSDLQSSVINKRIFNQIQALKQQKFPLLLIEGQQGWNLNENAFRGFILSMIDEKIPIIFTKGPEDTAKYILIMSKNKNKTPFSLRPYKKLESKKEIQTYILEGIPGIGPITANKLLNKFNSIKNIFTGSEKEVQEILGSKYELFKKITD